jgi:hypothetical protein
VEKVEMKKMSTEQMISSALKLWEDRRRCGLAEEMLLEQIDIRGENYYESKFWREHEKKVEAEIKKRRALRRKLFNAGKKNEEYRRADREIGALEGLLLYTA